MGTEAKFGDLGSLCIIKGLGQGKKLGFPTVNFEIPAGFRIAQGVYACFVKIRGQRRPAALYFGPKYNFGVRKPCLEVHIIDFKDIVRLRGERRGRTAWANGVIKVVKKIRSVRKFVSTAALKKQIKRDIIKIKKTLKDAEFS